MHHLYLLVLFLCAGMQAYPQHSGEEQQLLQRVEQFFEALEEQDTATFRNMFVDPSYMYIVRETSPDSVTVRARQVKGYSFRPGQIIRERMRESTTSVKIEGGIAVVWAPYDLWVNDKFSHCGVDVFTFVKSDSVWKIASLAYTIETTECQ